MERTDSDMRRLAEAERRFIEATISSTNNMLKDLTSMHELGTEINTELEVQNEKIMKTNGKLKSINTNLFVSDVILGKIRSPLGFGKTNKYIHTFESKHGKPAEWSGPMYIKKRLGYREKFFAVLGERLFRYKDSSHVSVEEDVIMLRDATLIIDETMLKFKLRVAAKKPKVYSFRCNTRNEFAGWVSIITKHSKSDKSDEKEDLKESFSKQMPQDTPTNTSFAEKNSHNLFRDDNNFLGADLPEDKRRSAVLDDNLDKIGSQLDVLHQLITIQGERVSSQNIELGNLNNSAETTLSRFGKTNTDLKRRI